MRLRDNAFLSWGLRSVSGCGARSVTGITDAGDERRLTLQQRVKKLGQHSMEGALIT